MKLYSFLCFPFALVSASPTSDSIIETFKQVDILGISGDAVENTLSRTFCGISQGVVTAIHESKKFFSPSNLTEEEAFADYNRMISLQKTPLAARFSLQDARQPEWLTVFALYNGFTYCKTHDPADISKFALPNPKLTASPDQMLPTGPFTLNSLNDFNAYNGMKTNSSQLDGRFIVTTDDKHQLITLTWRGSVFTNDFMADAVGIPTFVTDSEFKPYADVAPNGSDGIMDEKCRLPQHVEGADDYFMFAGFLHVMHKEVLDLVVQELTKAYAIHPDYSIAINGHSLGAAKSFITAFYLAKFYSKQLPLAAVYTYEQPLVGSTLLATWMADCITPSKVIRVVAANDAIPWMRAASNVQHPATVIEQFNPDPNQNVWKQCMGPNEGGCSKQHSCLNQSWKYHSFIGGVRVGSGLCWYIGKYKVHQKTTSREKIRGIIVDTGK